MAANDKAAQQLARRLFQLSLVDGAVSPERVAGVLAYVEAHKVAQPVTVLRDYRRLVAVQLAKSSAVVEHAGELPAQVLQGVAAAMSKKYNRPITGESRPNPSLVAGLRVRVGDDVYESSIAGQLATLGAAG